MSLALQILIGVSSPFAGNDFSLPARQAFSGVPGHRKLYINDCIEAPNEMHDESRSPLCT